MGAIYLRHEGTYVAMTERSYESEHVLQELLEQHPEMLADPAGDNGALLLVRSEAPIRDSSDALARWRLDHLYVDARGVRTLVEVKRSSDTRGRREVVAQMLDYAANAKSSFNAEFISDCVAEAARERECTVGEMLSEGLGIDDPDAFWQAVATNLEAERFRLIFVSDAIPPELRRIIEFLNGQMTQTEVLAIEVKQYTDAHGQQQTIVPRVIGDTSEARTVKKVGARNPFVDGDALASALQSHSPDAAAAAAAILDWGAQHPDLAVTWSRAGDIGLPADRQPLLRLWPEGTIEIRLETLRSEHDWNATQLDELVDRLQPIEGVKLGGGRRWPRTPLAPLADKHCRERFTALLDDVVGSLGARG